MAPKHSAPPPPVESSEETASVSSSDESEEKIAHSPPAAAPSDTAPPPLNIQQPEASDEEEDEEEEEEEDKANHTAPPSATENPPPPPPNRADSESDEEEQEETDDEAPQPESAPKQQDKAKVWKPLPSSEDKKAAEPFQRSWSKDDEVRILEALAAHRREHGTLPQPKDLEATLSGNLNNSAYGRKELARKLKTLKALYTRTVKRGDPPSKDIDRRIFDLAKAVWGELGSSTNGPANGTVPSDFGEMCKMYPYLAEEMKALERTQPGLFKREFSLIDNEKARVLDQKIKKQRVFQMKLELCRYDVTKEFITMEPEDLLKKGPHIHHLRFHIMFMISLSELAICSYKARILPRPS